MLRSTKVHVKNVKLSLRKNAWAKKWSKQTYGTEDILNVREFFFRKMKMSTDRPTRNQSYVYVRYGINAWMQMIINIYFHIAKSGCWGLIYSRHKRSYFNAQRGDDEKRVKEKN